MGQYYLIVNITKGEYLCAHGFNEGLKLMEFGLSSKGSLTALACLLSDGNGRGGGDLHLPIEIQPGDEVAANLVGSWAGDRIVVAGDYADEGNFLTRDQIRRYKREVPALLWDEYGFDKRGFSDFFGRSRKEVLASYKEDIKRIRQKDFKPTLYNYAQRFFKDISGDALKMICFDRYTRENFVENLATDEWGHCPEWLKKEVEMKKKEIKKKEMKKKEKEIHT